MVYYNILGIFIIRGVGGFIIRGRGLKGASHTRGGGILTIRGSEYAQSRGPTASERLESADSQELSQIILQGRSGVPWWST